MATPILATKLYAPSVRPKAVSRSRLIERLSSGLHRKFTLVSAPAGFGKTALVAEWVAERDRPVAWLSLGEEDGDARRFLTYLIAALQTVEPALGERVSEALQSPQAAPTEAVLTDLLNDVAGVQEPFLFVLDDYHTIEAQEVNNTVTFLLEHLPPQLHLVIATREDPPLPLARLRAQGQMTELRASDLRFTPDEATDFLNTVMGLDLSAEDVARLEARTEGWVAGLQMAALSLQGRSDTARFVQAFTGSHRFVLDYLVEEVLQGQRERVRSFLLQTSILERLSGPLCDAVTGQGDGQGMLEALERNNLFVIPLDDKREWYRYHHLFAEVLSTRLRKEPNLAPALHLRASEWFEQQGLRADAVRHALAAKDDERAAALIEPAWPEMDRSLQSATWLGWAQALPAELVRVRPVLRVGYAWALIDSGELEAGEARLNDLERWLATSPDGLVVADEAQFRALPATIAGARAHLAQSRGDLPGTVKCARRMLELLPPEDLFGRGAAASLLAFTQWASGDLSAVYPTFAEAMDLLKRAGNDLMAVVAPSFLADIRIAQGRLREAADIYEQALRLATEQGGSVPGTRELYAGLSEVHLERGELEGALRCLQTSQDLGEQADLPGTKYRWYVAMARLRETRGDVEGALELLSEAERLYFRTPVPNVRPVAALKARVWLRQGSLTEALAWAREQNLSTRDEPSYLREFEHLTLARLLIARNEKDDVHEALGLLARYLKAAETQERTGSVIEMLVLQALAHEARGDAPLALTSLERALAPAKPEGYVRIFVAEGEPMARLLSRAAAQEVMPDYGGKLLAIVKEGWEKESASYLPSALASQLAEPLSERELEVLHLVAQGLSNREIGKRLFRALDTVKGHNRNIFGKLGVQNRTEAVIRARELGLLEP